MDRLADIQRFIAQTEWRGATMHPLAGDASARRYFRLSMDGQSAVLMDAPPVDGACLAPFLHMTNVLDGFCLSPPRIISSDATQGFILMEDLGDALFATVIKDDPSLEMPLYLAAVDVLADLDQRPAVPSVPSFMIDVMCEQVAPVYDWYRKGLIGDNGSDQKTAFQAMLGFVLREVIDPRQALLLRDFHAENLVWLPTREGAQRVGLLDYQDAMMGPAGYDLVSMLQDARRDVSPDVVAQSMERFIVKTGRNRIEFNAAYAAIGLQRNLRILGIFVRLCQLHGKPRYIDFIPRVWGYVQDSLKHPALADLAEVIAADLPAPDQNALQRLKALCPTP